MTDQNSGMPVSAASAISLRRWGILVIVMFVLTSAVGGSLAAESSYLLVTLASHIGLALVTLGVSAFGAAFVARPYQSSSKAGAGLAALAALGGVIAGTIFLTDGQSNAALYAMEGFAGLGVLGGILMVILGGDTRKRASERASS